MLSDQKPFAETGHGKDMIFFFVREENLPRSLMGG